MMSQILKIAYFPDLSEPNKHPDLAKYRVLSMGVGVNSIAELIRHWYLYKCVIFAETHDEKAATYWYLEKFIKPFCAEKGLPFITVGKAVSVLDMAQSHKAVQLFFWQRECTRLFKIRPILAYVRKHLNARIRSPVLVDICFAQDESDRMGSDFYPKYAVRNFPLLADKITRQGCIDIIKEYGWPTPVRSGCTFCPFAGKKSMVTLYRNDPKP